MKSSGKRNQIKARGKLNERYANDVAFREQCKKRSRERYQNDPEYRKRTLERARKRYHEDPEYRKATIERAIQRYRKRVSNQLSEKSLMDDEETSRLNRE